MEFPKQHLCFTESKNIVQYPVKQIAPQATVCFLGRPPLGELAEHPGTPLQTVPLIARFQNSTMGMDVHTMQIQVHFVVYWHEVEVNFAVNKNAWMISQWDTRNPASKAVDGHLGTDVDILRDCAVTDRTTNPWWVVDLGEPRNISYVDVTTRSSK